VPFYAETERNRAVQPLISSTKRADMAILEPTERKVPT
jgi:hypothetical protein